MMNYHVSTAWIMVFLGLAIWELVWKGLALWRASQRRQLVWYLAILVLNTAGLLPILYLATTKETT